MSRNTVDSEIKEFSLAKEIVQVDVPLGEDSNIDVSELNVESDVVEKALNPDVDTSEEVDSLGEDVPSDEVETDVVEEVQSEEQSVIPDVVTNDDTYEIYTNPNDFLKVKDALTEAGVKEFITSEITFVPNNYIELDDETSEKVLELVDTLEDIDDVQNVYHNLSI